MLVKAAATTASPSSSTSPSLSPPPYSPITDQQSLLQLLEVTSSPLHSPSPIPGPSNVILPSSLQSNSPRARKPSRKKVEAETVTAKQVRKAEAIAKREKRAARKATK